MLRIILIWVLFSSIFNSTFADIIIPTCSDCPKPKNPKIEKYIDNILFQYYWPNSNQTKWVNSLLIIFIFNLILLLVLINIRNKQKNNKTN